MHHANIADQLAAASSTVLVVRSPACAMLRVRGGDRVSWLNGLLTCDLARSSVGDVVYGLVVTQKGRISCDLWVVFGVDELHVIVPKASVDELAGIFERHLIMEDAELSVDDEGFAVYLAIGPKSSALLDAQRSAGALGGLTDRTGLGGALFVHPRGDAAALEGALEATVGALGGLVGDEAAYDVLLVERAVPRFGKDFDTSTYPQEVGLEKTAVSFSKGCYLGQEVVCMLELRGHVNRRLVLLGVAGAALPERGAAVVATDGSAVGEVTGAVLSPTRGVLALAMIRRSHASVGAELRAGGVAATIVEPTALTPS